MKLKIKFIQKALLVTSIVGAAFACGDEHVYFPDAQNIPSGAHVKIMHASYDGMTYLTNPAQASSKAVRPVNFFLGGTKTNGTVITYGATYPPTGYAIVESAPTISAVAPFTAALAPTPELPEKVMINAATLSLDPAKNYTLAVIGLDASREVLTFEDNLEAAPIDGQAYLRFMNLMAGAPNNVDVIMTPPPNADGSLNASVKLFSNVAYKQVSGAFVPMPHGSYTNVQVLDAVTNAVIASLVTGATTTTFSGNRVYTLYVRGQYGASSTDVIRPIFGTITHR